MSSAWTQVRNCNSLQEAHLMKSVLESEGIEVQVPDEYTLGVQPIAAAIGGARVMVHPTDAARAVELLDAVLASPLPESSDGEG